MRRAINIIAYILIISVFYGCNSDVFIESMQPSESNIELDGNGDSTTIHFKTSDWEITAGEYSLDQVFFKVYNAEGVNIGSSGSPYLKGLGRMEIENEQIELTIERKHAKELTIKVGENTMSTDFSFSILANNEYEYKIIDIIISKCDRYVFDDITYSLDAYHYNGNGSKDGIATTVTNRGSTPITISLYPFKNEHHEVKFISHSPQAFSLLEEGNLMVDIPTMVNERLVMNGTRARYTSIAQELPISRANEEKQMTIPAHTTQRFTPFLRYEWFETVFTIRAHHPKTNKQRTIIGKLQSNMPKDFFIGRETIEK